MDEKEYSSIQETREHILRVKDFIGDIIKGLLDRMYLHDASKMKSPELETFDRFTPKLRDTTYGSDEYKSCLSEMRPALEHHYKENRHHPEHFKDGILGMNLVDLIEMLCDWYAASMRHSDGDILKSLEINQKRFGYSDDIKTLLRNTFIDFFWCYECEYKVCREFPSTCKRVTPGKEYVEERLKELKNEI